MALSAPRNTRGAADQATRKLSLKMAASTIIYAGDLVMLDGGYAKPGAQASSKQVVGRACETVDNSSGSAGDLSIDVEEGIFLWANAAAGDAAAQANVGGLVYINGDAEVTKTSTSRSIAGRLLGFEGSQCIVRSYIGVA